MANSYQQSHHMPVVQREERQTTLYAKDGVNWKKNMQIIDSTDPSDYVHLSRSTTTDPQTIHEHALPADIVPSGAAGKREKVETATDAAPHFNKANFTAANNTHITLEGRYMRVLRRLATDMFDDRAAIKGGPPVDAEFANLNFGDFDVHGGEQVSPYSIQQWIENAADDTEDALRTNVAPELQDAVPELIDVANEVKDSTLNFANTLIASTPALNTLEQNNKLVHYGGAPWART